MFGGEIKRQRMRYGENGGEREGYSKGFGEREREIILLIVVSSSTIGSGEEI